MPETENLDDSIMAFEQGENYLRGVDMDMKFKFRTRPNDYDTDTSLEQA